MFIGKLKVKVSRAKLSRDLCIFGTMDPYFIAHLSPDEKYRSYSRDGQGKFPVWENEFELNVAKLDNEFFITVFTRKSEVI